MDHSEVKHLPKVDHTPADLDEVAKLLLKGAALIEQRGHHKGSYSDGARLCFRGALNVAATGHWMDGSAACDEAGIRMVKALRRKYGYSGGWLGWNDAPERSPQDVISMMRAVALGL